MDETLRWTHLGLIDMCTFAQGGHALLGFLVTQMGWHARGERGCIQHQNGKCRNKFPLGQAERAAVTSQDSLGVQALQSEGALGGALGHLHSP